MSLREIEFRLTGDGDCFVNVDGESQYRDGQTSKRACIMTPNGPIWLEGDFTIDGWQFKVSFPEVQRLTHSEFDYGEDARSQLEEDLDLR